MSRSAGIRSDERQVNLGFKHAGQVHFGPLRRVPQALEGHPVLAQVDTGLLTELADQPLKYLLVEVVASQIGVSVGGLNLEDAIPHLQDGYIEGAAAQVEDRYRSLLIGFVHTVGQRRGRRLVDDTQYFQAGDGPGVFGSLALGVVEVSRDCNHSLGDGLTQFGFSVLLDFL